MNMPTVNSSESPGRTGKIAHSMKMIKATPHRAQFPRPWMMYAGSSQSGSSIGKTSSSIRFTNTQGTVAPVTPLSEDELAAVSTPGVGPIPSRGRTIRASTRTCSRTATGATCSTRYRYWRSRRSSPTSTPGGTRCTWRSRTGSTTSTSARSCAPRTRSTSPECTSSDGGAGTGAERWSPTATCTSTTTRTVARCVAWLSRSRHHAGRGRQPARLGAAGERRACRSDCCLVFGSEGPGSHRRAGRRLRAAGRDHPVRLDAIAERRCGGGDRDVPLGTAVGGGAARGP